MCVYIYLMATTVKLTFSKQLKHILILLHNVSAGRDPEEDTLLQGGSWWISAHCAILTQQMGA